jgi:signal transduction histidine kinase
MKDVNDFFRNFFYTDGFPARWYCGEWTDFHGGLYIFSNVAIWGAYFAIPLALMYFIRKRKDVPFQKIFWLFILFIVFCGTTHLADALIFWLPAYRINAALLFATALVSWGTFFSLFKVLPQAFTLKTPAQLQRIIEEQTAALHQANHRLAASEQAFRALVNNHPDLLLKLNKALNCTFVSEAAYWHKLLPLASFVGKNLKEIGESYPNIDHFIAVVHQSMASGTIQKVEWTTPVPANGEIHHLEITMIPMPTQNGLAAEEIILTIRNNSALKNREEKLASSVENLQELSKNLINKNKQLENFAYIVSHNLRSPIGNLTALFNLHACEDDPSEKESLFAKMEQVAQRLDQTVEDLTAVIKVRQDTDIEKENLSFRAVLDKVVESLAVDIAQTGMTLHVDFQAIEQIHYPKVYLESIFLNLLTNAIKYRSPDRQPAVNFQTNLMENGKIELRCRDNGLGIDLARYGEKIFGLNKTFHKHPDSRGVGLFLTKNQIESMGGAIYVESQVNIGSTFIIQF